VQASGLKVLLLQQQLVTPEDWQARCRVRLAQPVEVGAPAVMASAALEQMWSGCLAVDNLLEGLVDARVNAVRLGQPVKVGTPGFRLLCWLELLWPACLAQSTVDSVGGLVDAGVKAVRLGQPVKVGAPAVLAE
jgi:hypothetical protein